MLPQLALFGCLFFIRHLFRVDFKLRDRAISWAPLVWMFLAGSRWTSSWLNLGSPVSSVDDYSEGSPVDRLVFFAIILWGVYILYRRNINWTQLLGRNAIIVLYLLYCLSSIVWSDEPFVLVKRWIKDLGNPIIALVMLTELRPYEAIGITLRRLAFLLLPLSVLFIRYFPALGRTYHADGSPMYTGVGHQKNDLGLMCLVAGIYLAWKLLQTRTAKAWAERIDRYDVMLMVMLAWLLRMSNSQTALVCLLLTIAILMLSRVGFVARRPVQLVSILVVIGSSFGVLQATMNIKETILGLLGRDATLTGRTELWEVIGQYAQSPIVGAGFMSFWTGDRMAGIWKALGGGINQAHSGYFEQYLNLGYVGIGFIAAIMIAALVNIRTQLKVDPSAAVLRLCLLVTAALYNYTEASFYGINNMWVLMLAASIDMSAVMTSVELSPVFARDQVQASAAVVPVPAAAGVTTWRMRPEWGLKAGAARTQWP